MFFQDRLALRVFNRVGERLCRSGMRIADFDPAGLEAAARRAAGYDDFGPTLYREPLTRLCSAYESDRDLTFFGRWLCHSTLRHLLKNRLLIQHELRTDPGILREEIRRPLFVLGLPRTGTSWLFRLLTLDPACRPLLFWEAMTPAPPPRPETYASDPRIAKTWKSLRWFRHALPDISAIHEFRADGPEECLGLLMNVFLTPFFRGRIPAYREWLDNVPEAQIDAAYAEYRTQLQLLQRHVRGEHWILKCPSHLLGLGGLLNNFPDAAVVQTHRDLGESIPSLCSLSALAEQLCYRRVDRDEVGRRVLHMVEQLLGRGLRARDALDSGGARVFDVAYADLVRDPMGTVQRIYERFGYGYSEEFQDRLRRLLATQDQQPRLRHGYSLAEFGLAPGDLQRRFAGYVERFQVAV